MTSIAVVKHIADGLQAIKDLAILLRDRGRARHAMQRAASKAVLKAALQTRSYLADVRSGKPMDPTKESALSQLWMRAHIAISRFDADLADRCLIKADCWSDPRMWNDPRYRHIPLDLDGIVDSYRRLARAAAPRKARRTQKESSPVSPVRPPSARRPRRSRRAGGVLHLTVERAFFQRIVSGRKRTEYRRICSYWRKRLEGKTFSEVVFRNGRTIRAPTARVEFKGLSERMYLGVPHYAIRLGRVIETRNMR